MARKILCVLIKLSFICKVLSVYAQPIQQYLHLSGVPPQTVAVPAIQSTQPTHQPLPSPELSSFISGLQHQAPTNQATSKATNQPRTTTGLPSYTALDLPNLVAEYQRQTALNQASSSITNQPRPTTGIPSFSALALPNLVSGLQPLPNQSKVLTPSNPSSIDSNLLNNLAVALQLLIVSNILNSPPPEVTPSVKETRSCSENNSNYPQYEFVMPNSQFVATSGFAEPNLMQTYSPARSSKTLRSPYEVLSQNPSYLDTLSNNYVSVNPRKDFQSPYAMIDQDLFSMNELF